MLDIITDNIDIWTSAQMPKTNGGRGRRKNGEQSQYGIKKLRELILELAVRGKLVPQDPKEESASVLLEKIAKEKAKLIKASKIKKQIQLHEINDSEKYFILPPYWEWVRLGDVSEFINGFAFKSSDFSNIGIGVVKIGDIQNGEISTNSMSRVNKDVVDNLDNCLTARNGEMLIAMSGATTGKLGFNTTNETFYINQRVGKISPHLISPKFLYYPLTMKISENLEKSMGSAIPNLSTAQIKDIVLAIPPIAEQHRIVAKVNELMTLCDQLEQQQTNNDAAHKTLVQTLLGSLTNTASADDFQQTWKLIENNFDTLFTTEHSIDQLKKTILQLAVMGKLVPQDPKDEPANVLLGKITKEKKQLIKEGKIKKQKPLSPISEEEKPYDLSNGWTWVKVGDVSLSTDYGLSEKTFEKSQGIPVLKMGDIQYGQVILGGQKVVSKSVEGLPDLFLQNGDLLYNRTNSAELVGKTGIFLGENNKYTFASYLIRIRLNQKLVNSKYMNFAMNSSYFRNTQIEPNLKQQCGQANINGTIMQNMLIPLPPKREQDHIVSKVNDLMTLCNELRTRLSDARFTQLYLTDAIVEHAVA